MKTQRALLIILDGWGLGSKRRADAIALADTPYINNLYQKYPSSELVTYGEAVGLPEGQMGNSEVGHLNIGAGRIVYQELVRLNKAVRERTLHQNPMLLDALKYAKNAGKKVHLMGLVSDGGVHSHINHLKALCEIADNQGVTAYVHAFTDGRDCDPKSGLGFLNDLQNSLKQHPSVKIASVIGRYYAMDRDKRWERIKLAYDLLVHGTGTQVTDLGAAIEQNYAAGVTDEFLKPMILDKKGVIEKGDVVISFNFRTDRPREIAEVLSQKDMPEHNMYKLDLKYVTMTRYDDTYKNVSILYDKDNLKETMGEVVSKAGLTQIRIAETEKYPHVTFFFSGGQEKPFAGETRILVPSAKVATYDLQPEMSANGITEKIIENIQNEKPNFICLNYANTDMVGHTGVFSAAVKAAEVVDGCVKKLVTAALKADYEILVIADHGNSDYMINDDGSPNTAHTLNPVPCIYVSKQANGKNVKNGKLADIAPTLLGLLGIPPSALMDGENLIY
jgi:2,3-bisphosphoglycerate-independent phosphoglycerate mutase